MNANVGWDVFLNGKKINTVFYTPDCDAEYVRTTLINHDGLDSRIVVRRAAGVHPVEKFAANRWRNP